MRFLGIWRIRVVGLMQKPDFGYVGASMQQLGVPIDPSGGLPLVGILVVVALVASYLPAHRAARLEPAVALRDD